MQIFILLFYALCSLVCLTIETISSISENLVGTILKALLFVASLTPGFQTMLERGVDADAIKAASLPALIRQVAANPIYSFVIPKLVGIDVLEIDAHGKLRSLLKSQSPYNGLAPDRIATVADALPILILDHDSGVAIDSPGPILMTKGFVGEVRSGSVIVLCAEGELDGARVHAPIVIKDQTLRVNHLGPESSLVDLVDVLNGARVPMLKALRGEALVQPTPLSPAPLPPRRSVVKYLWKNMSCEFNWTSLHCRWNLQHDDLQVLVEQALRDRWMIATPLRFGMMSVNLKLLNPRAQVDGDRLGLKFDLSLRTPGGQGPFTDLMRNPVVVKNVSVWTKDVAYDPVGGELRFDPPVLTDLDLPADVDPALRGLTLNAVNFILKRSLNIATYDLKQHRTLGFPLLWYVLKSLKFEGDRLHVHAGVGRCERALTGD